MKVVVFINSLYLEMHSGYDSACSLWQSVLSCIQLVHFHLISILLSCFVDVVCTVIDYCNC